MKLTVKQAAAAMLLAVSPLTMAADIDGTWHCEDDFKAGTTRINSVLTQQYDSASSKTNAQGQVQIYNQGQLSYQFDVSIRGTFAINGRMLSEYAEQVNVQLSNQPQDMQQAQVMRDELEKAFKAAPPVELLQIDDQQLQYKEPQTGETTSCQRVSAGA